MRSLTKIVLTDDFIQKMYSDFSTNCLKKNADFLALRKEFHTVEDLFLRRNQTDELYDKTLQLSEQLKLNGSTKLSDMLINELSKFFVRFDMPNEAEKLLWMSVDNCRQKGDGLHELARLIDLENLYKMLRERKNLFLVLKEKKECCKSILANYDEQVVKYDALVKAPTSKPSVQVQLAFTYSDLARMLERNKPRDAFNMYNKALDIYSELGQHKEVRYLQKKLDNMQITYGYEV